MIRILILGAGRSAYHVIAYLLEQSKHQHWQIRIADQHFSSQTLALKERYTAEWIQVDLNSETEWNAIFFKRSSCNFLITSQLAYKSGPNSRIRGYSHGYRKLYK